MTKVIEARILLEEFGDMARLGTIHTFIDVLKNNCSVMLFDQDTLCYKLMFKKDFWNKSVEQFPDLEKYYFKEQYDN